MADALIYIYIYVGAGMPRAVGMLYGRVSFGTAGAEDAAVSERTSTGAAWEESDDRTRSETIGYDRIVVRP